MNARPYIRMLAVAVLLAALSNGVFVSKALAHVILVRSEPADGASVANSPHEIRMWFDEGFVQGLSSVQVLDINGHAVAPLAVYADAEDEGLMVVKTPALSPGVYNVTYKVLAADDGHFTQGHLVFGVGVGTAVTAAGDAQPQVARTAAESVMRWLNLTALAALAGALAVFYLVLVPALKRRDQRLSVRNALAPAARRILVWAFVSCGLAFGVGLMMLAWQSVELAPDDGGVIQLLASGGRLLTGSRWGGLWLARQMILLSIGWLLFARLKSGQTTARATIAQDSLTGKGSARLALLILALMAVQALNGHAAALAADKTLAVIADTLHLLAAAIWVGGLLALTIGLAPLFWRRQTSSAADEVKAAEWIRAGWGPFSRWAAVSVALLVITGLFSMGRQVATVDALLTTPYGEVLLAKVGIMVLVGGFGLLNSVLLRPGLIAPVARLLRRPIDWTPLPLGSLPSLVMVESVLGLAVLLAAGILTSLRPARGQEFDPPKPVQAAVSQMADDLLVSLDTKPNRPGINVVTLHIFDSRRPAPAPFGRVSVRFARQESSENGERADAVEIGSGTYQIGGSYLDREGPWQIDVTVQRTGMPDSLAHFVWSVASPVIPRPLIISNRSLEPASALAAVLLLLLLSGMLAWQYLRREAPNLTWNRWLSGRRSN